MRSDNRRSIGRRRVTRQLSLAAVVVGTLGGCRASHAPRWAVPATAEVATRVEGSWAIITTTAGDRPAGELIAAHADTLFLLVGDSLSATPVATVRTVELSRYRSNAGQLVLWTLLGTLSTVSHGFYLLLTAPVWLITGAVTAIGDTQSATLETRNPGLLAPWARFPAGLPPSIDRTQLRSVARATGR
jgi:hypothetical protein